MSGRLIVVVVGASLFLGTTPAGAHGDLHGSDPEPGATLKDPPGSVSVDLTEAPGPGSTFAVSDGCRGDAAERVAIKGTKLVASVPQGQPGDWVMRYRAVSSVDGHVTKGSIHFFVRGEPDCSPEPAVSGTDTQIGGGAGTRVANPDPPEEGEGLPLIPLGIGTVLLVGIAVMLRASTKE